MANTIVKELAVPVLIMLATTTAYAVTSYFMLLDASALEEQLDALHSDLQQRAAKIQSSLESYSSVLPQSARQHVIKQRQKLIDKQCEVAPEPFESLQVVRQLLANKTELAHQAYLDVRRPIAHLTARKNHTAHPSKGPKEVKYWGNPGSDRNFVCNQAEKGQGHQLRVKVSGRYYVYSQVTYKYKRHPPASFHSHVTTIMPAGVRSAKHDVMENSYLLGNEPPGGVKEASKTSYHGAVLRLEAGSLVEVKVTTGTHTKLELGSTDTYFGMFMIS